MNLKVVVTVMIALLITRTTFSQGDPNESLNINKLKKYETMKDGGILLIIVGGIFIVAGTTIELAQAGRTVVTVGMAEPEKDAVNKGAILFCTGLVIEGVGIPLAVTGRRRAKKYKDNPEVISLGIKSTPHSAGLSLRYRL